MALGAVVERQEARPHTKHIAASIADQAEQLTVPVACVGRCPRADLDFQTVASGAVVISVALVVRLALGGGYGHHARQAEQYACSPGATDLFGPDEASAATFEDARSFGRKGRSVMLLYGVINQNDFYSDVGFSRFIVDRLALGGYASGGLQGASSDRIFLVGGVQALIDFPVAGSLSVLLAPRVGYRWTDVSARYPNPNARYGSPSTILHELQLAAPIFLALHLHDGLVLGIGPEVSSDRRLATMSGG